MADFKFTQTGAEIQALLNRLAGSGLYRHELTFQTSTVNQTKLVIISTKSSAYVTSDFGNVVGNVLEWSKMLQIYLYSSDSTDFACEQAIHFSCGINNENATVTIAYIALGTTILSATLTTLVSDTVAQLL